MVRMMMTRTSPVMTIRAWGEKRTISSLTTIVRLNSRTSPVRLMLCSPLKRPEVMVTWCSPGSILAKEAKPFLSVVLVWGVEAMVTLAPAIGFWATLRTLTFTL